MCLSLLYIDNRINPSMIHQLTEMNMFLESLSVTLFDKK